ncbi:MAG: hypothetical protein ACP5JT_06145 [Thermoplasmata archaeon]|jgi:hypothetical protein
MKMCEYLNNLMDIGILYYVIHDTPSIIVHGVSYYSDVFLFKEMLNSVNFVSVLIFIVDDVAQFLNLESTSVFFIENAQKGWYDENKIHIYFR